MDSSRIFSTQNLGIIKPEESFNLSQIFEHFYNPKVAFLAGIISSIGYIGFTSSQMLAGAKLASAAFPVIDQQTAVLIMGVVIVGYTVLGGIKAVIFHRHRPMVNSNYWPYVYGHSSGL
ncbi:MAG: hypothetical protein R2764_21525 [Bacteroidales bacterium]